MEFAFNEKVESLRQRLIAFRDEYVLPNEATFREQVETGDRWQPVPIIAKSRLVGQNVLVAERDQPLTQTLDFLVECKFHDSPRFFRARDAATTLSAPANQECQRNVRRLPYTSQVRVAADRAAPEWRVT